MSKFLNYDKVLCLSPHPDDVEYGMLGSIMKFKDTQFDLVVLSGGGDFDESYNKNRMGECKKVWKDIDNLNGSFISNKKFVKNTDEDEWVNLIEESYDIPSYGCIFVPPTEDAHFEHSLVSGLVNPLTRRIKCGIIEYKTPSFLSSWNPNFFVDLMIIENRNKEDNHPPDTSILFKACIWYIKLNKLNLFESQQNKSYFKKNSVESFHSDYQCSVRGINNVESFKIIKGYN
tara:strand:- start:393 stop:1085 length:693 start_codon:yes stop_codon:yes gene_type:complete